MDNCLCAGEIYLSDKSLRYHCSTCVSVIIMLSQHRIVAWSHSKQIPSLLLDKCAQQSLGKVKELFIFALLQPIPFQTFSSTLLYALASSSMPLYLL